VGGSSAASTVKQWIIHPAFRPVFDFHDLALVILTNRLSVAPARLLQISTNPVGVLATFVGFGAEVDANGVATVQGQRLAANNVIDSVDLKAGWLITDFDSPSGNTSSVGDRTPVALEGTTAVGDSGAPLFVDFGSGPVVLGVLWGGYNPFGLDSTYGDVSLWTDIAVEENREFVSDYMLRLVPEPTQVLPCALAFGLFCVAGVLRRCQFARDGVHTERSNALEPSPPHNSSHEFAFSSLMNCARSVERMSMTKNKVAEDSITITVTTKGLLALAADAIACAEKACREERQKHFCQKAVRYLRPILEGRSIS
jgi:hypothetical protein